MKKTLSINISGFVFHIDEDAYEKLHRYLDAIKSHFRGFEGRDEVISDVEARVAEILQKKISGSKEVITLEDVDEVIGILGQPSDFGMDDDTAGQKETSYSSIPKRLYRDPERKVFGGICSGLGAYFNLDPVWIRLIFIFMVLISGFGLLIYLILWMVVPEARTTAERLEMRGEPVNISNIEKSLSDEMHELKNKLKDFKSQAKSTYRKQKEDFKSHRQDQFLDGIGEIGRVILRIFLIFLGSVIVILGIFLTIAYLSIFFHYPILAYMGPAGIQTFPLYAIIDKVFLNDADLRTFATGLMILLGIPLIMMLWAGIRLIFGLPRARFVRGLAGLVWFCALLITLVFGLKVSNSFRNQGEFSRESILKIVRHDTIRVVADLKLPESFTWEHSGVAYFPEIRMAVRDDRQVLYGIPLLKFKPSKDSIARLIVITTARGAFTDEATESAEKVTYNWQQKNDTLLLSDSFAVPEEEKWRKQEARVEVQLPEGTAVSLDDHLHPLMGYHKYISGHEPIGTLFIMTNEGLVKSEE
jgi:phage shock protein PspC (stress-responsive transcriptional regulator)